MPYVVGQNQHSTRVACIYVCIMPTYRGADANHPTTGVTSPSAQHIYMWVF